MPQLYIMLEFNFDSQSLMRNLYASSWLTLCHCFKHDLITSLHFSCTPCQNVQLFYLHRHSISDEAQCRIWGSIIWALNTLFVKYNSNRQLSVNLIIALEVSPTLTCFSVFLLNKIQCLLCYVFQSWNSTWAKYKCKVLYKTP